MITLSSLKNDDISVDEYGNIATLTDKEAMVNIIYNVDKTNKGECALNTDLGTDFFGTVFSATPSLARFKAQNIAQTEKLDGVLGVSDFTFDYNSDTTVLNYTKTVNTVYGEVKVNG